MPKDQLGDPAVRGQTIGLSESTVQKLLQDWKQKYNRDLRRPREWACEAILKTQIYAPSAAVRIMDYFKPAQNVLVPSRQPRRADAAAEGRAARSAAVPQPRHADDAC